MLRLLRRFIIRLFVSTLTLIRLDPHFHNRVLFACLYQRVHLLQLHLAWLEFELSVFVVFRAVELADGAPLDRLAVYGRQAQHLGVVL